MFLLELPPVSGQKVPPQVQVAQAPKSKTPEPPKTTAPSGGKDEVIKAPIDQVIKGLEINLKTATNLTPSERKDLINELNSYKLSLATKNETVTIQDISRFLENALDQPYTKKGNENYKRYSEIALLAYESTIDKNNKLDLAALQSLKRQFNETIKYREEGRKYLEDAAREEKELNRLLKDISRG